jgi:hypothetical protein
MLQFGGTASRSLRGIELYSHVQMMAIVPVMMLGLLAATCLVASAEWDGGAPVRRTVLVLGAGEETAEAHVSFYMYFMPIFSSFFMRSQCILSVMPLSLPSSQK